MHLFVLQFILTIPAYVLNVFFNNNDHIYFRHIRVYAFVCCKVYLEHPSFSDQLYFKTIDHVDFRKTQSDRSYPYYKELSPATREGFRY